MEYRENTPRRRQDARASGVAVAASQERGRNYSFFAVPLLLIALMVLSACASISEEECLAADWYSIGVEDGSKGYPMSRIGNYRKDCAEVGVAPDADEYAEGRDYGLETFCTYERGYAEGKRGFSNKGVCPPGQLEAEFMEGYGAGRYVYDINQQIRGMERQLADVGEDRANLEAGLEGNYYIEEDGTIRDLTTLERRLLFDRLRELNSEYAQLEAEISGLRASISGS